MKQYIKSWWKALVVTLAITAIWYAAEFEQFGTLQWDRWCDNVVGVIYFFVLWWAFNEIDKNKQ